MIKTVIDSDVRMGEPTCHKTGIVKRIHNLTRRTGRTETSKYPEEKKSTEISLVAASEREPALKRFVN